MKRLLLLIPAIFLCACQTLPVIHPPVSSTGKKIFVCPQPFLTDKYRLVHAIEVRTGGKTRNAIIGVTVVDPFTRSISCAMMTAEGMVLFDAESEPGGLKINRALPPLDSRDFAENMIEDIKLIFLTPGGKIRASGYLPDGASVCRYVEENGNQIDVIENESEGLQVKLYSPSDTLKRHIRFSHTGGNIYRHIDLQASGIFDYALSMTLIEAQPVQTKKFKRK